MTSVRFVKLSSGPLVVGIAVLVLAAATGVSLAQPALKPALSPRNANYTIDVRLDPETKMLEGQQTLEWRNIQDRSTDELWFHLYWNAWRNDRSTWLLEDRLRRGPSRVEKLEQEDWGWLEVDSIRLLEPEEPGVVRPSLASRIAAPDDGNPDDRTVMIVSLPQAVEPGETVRLAMTWRAKIPRTFARTGFRGNYFFIAHWFPKLGVFEGASWNCHQFHSMTEFYSDYGVYDVTMTVPEDWVLGATGREVSQTENEDGTVTHNYYQEDVHGFAWTTSPNFVVREDRFMAPGLPPVNIRLLAQPERLGQADRILAATKATLLHYGSWYGPYPYGHVTAVDPAFGSRTGGMEYPTLFTCGSRRFTPEGSGSPEGVTIHEAGHQFWYGMVGNNEFEHAWLDEGFNTFSTHRTFQTAFGERVLVHRYLNGFVPLAFRDIAVPEWSRLTGALRSRVIADPPSTPSYRYYPRTARTNSYEKAALWLLTLERHLGWETLQQILSTFFERSRFRHPTPGEFFAVADEVAGQDLSWFFDQVYRSTVEFDYGIESVESSLAESKGWVERDGELVYVEPEEVPDVEQAEGAETEKIYRSEVIVRRWGQGRFPVQVLVVFEDGHEIRQPWDGKDGWRRLVYQRPSKVARAEVDPDRVLMLDARRTNNSRLREPANELPARKWSSKWMVWFQEMFSTVAFFM